jgi:MoaA/NifB/PqqE/SkfB family radical SAM enzyme
LNISKIYTTTVENDFMISHNQSANTLNRIYLEVTNRCNLDCGICIRNTWEDLPGSLSLELYQKLISDIQLMDPLPEIFFGGYGEPLSHPDIIKMILSAKQNGSKTALITNGTLLSEKMAEALISSGLDRLWVSLDGVHSESYHDVQLGEYLPQILHNLENFQKINTLENSSQQDGMGTELGIAFVIMKTNAADLFEIIELGQQIGVNSFFITYMEAYSEDMAKEIFYPTGISRYENDKGDNKSSLTTLDVDPQIILTELIQKSLEEGNELHITGSIIDQDQPLCPFVARGAVVVRWDGEVSPCLPLLYSHFSILGNWKRQVYSHSFGNIRSSSILDLWKSPGYVQLRERLQDNRFSPCVNCRDCWLSEDNLLDCMGYEHPTCGGCLWASGLIQCP